MPTVHLAPYRLTVSQSVAWHQTDAEGEAIRREIRATAARRATEAGQAVCVICDVTSRELERVPAG